MKLSPPIPKRYGQCTKEQPVILNAQNAAHVAGAKKHGRNNSPLRGNYMNTNPCEKEIDYIRQSLNKFNEEIVGSDGHTPLNIIEYDKDGNIIGGLLGGTYWGWMYIDILWVHQNHRKKGLGTKLLECAEKEAVSRGCHHVHLDTMSWQAPMFYKKHGYEEIGVLPDIPKGNRKHLLMKALS